MIAGKPPFDGENAVDVINSILNKEPAPLYLLMPEVSRDLERIINKSLRKDREERYQTVKDLLIDLKDIKQELEFHNKLERTAPPEREKANTQIIDATTGDAARATSSAESAASEIKKHKSAFIAALVILSLAIGGLGFWYFNNSSADAKQISSIAVLPFQNDSESGETEYLSDGITESLITRLAQLPKLNVKAHSSVFRYKGKEDEVQRIGKELNVEAVLTGRIVRRGNDLTLYITLVDAATEKVLWKSDYNRSMTNLAALQSDVALDVSNEMRLKLSGADERKLTKSYTTNAQAYQLYMKGRFHVLKTIKSETETSISYFQQAIELDPNYALAYAGLADAYRGRVVGGEMPSAEFFPKAKAAANKAIELDETLAEAHANLGHVMFWYDWDWNAAEIQHQRALARLYPFFEG
jgi:TolB-like protein